MGCESASAEPGRPAWARGERRVFITTGLVSATTTPMLLKLVVQGKLTPEKFVTHRFTFDQIMEAYETFSHAAETKALKVIITR